MMKGQILTMIVLVTFNLGCAFKLVASQTNVQDGFYLNTIKMPADTQNIYVKKLSTDKHSSQFVVFVRKFVPMHKHMHHSESVYVLSGEGEFTLDGKVSKISAGHFIYIPEGAVHGVKTTSEEPLKVLSVQAPEFFGKDRVPVKQ